jgi:hypothetical protein
MLCIQKSRDMGRFRPIQTSVILYNISQSEMYGDVIIQSQNLRGFMTAGSLQFAWKLNVLKLVGGN